MDSTVQGKKFNDHLVQHFPGVYNYVRRLVRNGTVAEDLTQDAFLKAWQAFERYRPERPFFPWILQIARRTALDYLKRRHEIQHKGILLSAPDSGADPEQAAQEAENGRILEAALQTLPEIQRTAVYLFYVENLDISELSSILKKSQSGITVLLHRARQKLKKHLELRRNPHF